MLPILISTKYKTTSIARSITTELSSVPARSGHCIRNGWLPDQTWVLLQSVSLIKERPALPINYKHPQFHNLSIGAAFCRTGLEELKGLNATSTPSMDDFHTGCVGFFNLSQGFELIFRSLLLASENSIQAKGNHPLSSLFQSVKRAFPEFEELLTDVGIDDKACAKLMETLEKAPRRSPILRT